MIVVVDKGRKMYQINIFDFIIYILSVRSYNVRLEYLL